MLALNSQPNLKQAPVNGPAPLATSVPIMLRWVTPVIKMRRTKAKDPDTRGKNFRNGNQVVIGHGTASQDEEVFDDTFQFDNSRTG